MTAQVPTPGARIVVGVDGSKPSKLSLGWAVRISVTTGASIDAVTGWHFPGNFGWGYVSDAWDPLAAATDETARNSRPPKRRTRSGNGNR